MNVPTGVPLPAGGGGGGGVPTPTMTERVAALFGSVKEARISACGRPPTKLMKPRSQVTGNPLQFHSCYFRFLSCIQSLIPRKAA
jgi:hypothetical protein